MAATQNSDAHSILEKLKFEPFDDSFDRAAFCCGESQLDTFFIEHCGHHHVENKIRCTVALVDGDIAGYYWIVADSISLDQIVDLDKDEFPQAKYFSIPCIYLGMIAVDKRYRGYGIGQVLMMRAMRDAIKAAEIVGVFAFTLEAINAKVAELYRSWGFDYSRTGPNGEIFMYQRLSSIRKALGF